MPFVADVIEPGDVHAIACALRSARRRAGAARVQIGSFSRSRHSARTVPTKRSATAFAFGERIGVLMILIASPSEDGVEVTRELAVAVADEEAKRRRSDAQRPGELAGLLADPGATRIRRPACELHAPAAKVVDESLT